MENYIVKKNVEPFYHGRTIQIKQNDHLAIRAHMNIRATIKSPLELKLKDTNFLDEHELIFSKENLVSKDNSLYVFQTKYSKSLDDVLDLKKNWVIPYQIIEKYTKESNKNLKKIAYTLKGSRENCVDILKEFYKFAREKVKNKKTYGRTLNSIIKELKHHDYFYGNCKEVSLLISSLCDCIQLPSRRITGKFTADEGGHMWTEVAVPYRYSYIWIPVDPAMQYFNEYDGEHIVHSYVPQDNRSIVVKFLDKVLDVDPELSLKIEYV